MISDLKYRSEIKNLGDKFFNQKFNIPIYQRLYVWQDEQVKTLIEDLLSAYNHNDKHIYYLGSVVVVENGGAYDLIDGQQRFTTLKILRELLGDTTLTLTFSARDNVWEEFKMEQSNNADIQRMINAKKNLSEIINNRKTDIKNFLKYIQDQVQLVITFVPQNTDLNKLFELINGRGEQLLQHEILKAKILKFIKDDYSKYGKIWDICANMDNHIENNIKESLLKKDKYEPITWKDYFDEFRNLDFQKLIAVLKKDEIRATESFTISEILSVEGKNGGFKDAKTVSVSDDGTRYLPIISFPTFLLYVLESFKSKENIQEKIEFKDKNLVKIFEKKLLHSLDGENEEDAKNKVKDFICHLFEFRKKFDMWIIRDKKDSGDNSNETEHKIIKLDKLHNDSTVSRQINVLEDSNNLALLQSMLYHAHTRQTQEWIIPFINNVTDKPNENLLVLKKIDDYLYSNIGANKTILERANDFTTDNCSIDCSKIIKKLKQIPDNYHEFSHYWFYKMDWIIWDLSDKKDERKDFKFTARNSIEHISPQNPQDENKEEDKVSEKYLHSFGNLFLISGSDNSSVGSEGFKTKISKFVLDKKVKNLKLLLIKDFEYWGDRGTVKHLYNCLQLVKTYYAQEVQK